MLILLPPSEGKTDPAGGPALDLATLSLPELSKSRRTTVAALLRLARGSRTRARRVLGLSEWQDAEVARDASLDSSPTAAAGRVYTGVLFDALGYPSLPAAARRRADRQVLVASALFGAVRLDDAIPAYRLSGDVSLPRLGRLTTWWRPRLAGVMADAADTGPVLDLRSSTYAAMWAPPPDVAQRTLATRVLQRRPDGRLMVVSHHSKATKGRLARSLLSQPERPRTAAELADLVASLGYDVQLDPPHDGHPGRLDVVVDDL